jgi:hypothetical protein
MGSTTKTESESKLPQWQEDFIRNQILPKAESIGSTPFSAYTGDRVAGLSDLEKQAQSTMAGYDYGQPAYQQAQSVFSQISGMTPQDYAAMNQQNMNPYQDQVIGASEAAAARRRAQERIGEESAITQAGAFGGNRRDVYQGERQAAYEVGQNEVIANLLSQGYTQAQAATMAQLGNRGQAAGNLAATAGQAGQALTSGASAQQQLGQLDRMVNQSELDAAYAEFERGNQYPLQQLQALLAGGSGVPTGLGTTTGTETKGGLGYALQAVGAAGQGIGAAMSGFGCWVAREVYGADNIQWVQFRDWLFNIGPKWFKDAYLKYGEGWAEIIKRNPWTKVILRPLMDIARKKAGYK